MRITPTNPISIPSPAQSAVTVDITAFHFIVGSRQVSLEVTIDLGGGNAKPDVIVLTAAQTKTFMAFTGTSLGDALTKASRASIAQWLSTALANVPVTTTVDQDVA